MLFKDGFLKHLTVMLLGLLAFAGSGAGQTSWITPTTAEVDAIYPDIEALYIDLHQNPELAFQEAQTAAKLAARVKALGYEVTTGVGGTGIVAVMRNGPGLTVMLRTELDALPVEEKTGLPFASKVVVKNVSGQSIPVMHACGHDIHMSAWAGTARLMAEHKDRWHGTLVMVGQPAEESGAGASAMLKDGLFTRFPRPDFALSLHDDDTMPAGTIGYHPGPFRAMSDGVTIVVHGRGGHAAMPMNTVDPIVLAARIVLALQTIVSRENNPTDPVVITVGSIHGGTRGNVIPDEVQLQLSVRTYTPEVREKTLAAIRRVARGEAISAGAPREPDVITGGNATASSVVYNRPGANHASGESPEGQSWREDGRRDACENDVGRFRRILDDRQGSVRAAAHRRSERFDIRGNPENGNSGARPTFARVGAGPRADHQGRDSSRSDRTT